MEKRAFVITGLSAVLFLAALIGLPATSLAQTAGRCASVVIQSNEGIFPETVTVSKGDCVVWVNMTRGEDLRVSFKEGKTCKDATIAPKGFKLDFEGCYVTDLLDFGQTSSLVFVEPGRFDYEVVRVAPRAEGKALLGSVIVK